MRDQEFNGLSMDDLEQVAGGNRAPDGTPIPDEYTRSFCCIVHAQPSSSGDVVVVTGNIPLRVDDFICVPAFNYAGVVTEVRPGASEYDNSITIYANGISAGLKTTQVYLVVEWPHHD